MPITVAQLIDIMGCKAERAALFVDPMNETFDFFEISTPLRQAAWLAQVGEESGGLMYTREIWGPTSWQRAYEPPSAKAKELGNRLPGDGRRYCGHGLIQTTGRYNHMRARDGLREYSPDTPDFEAEPELLELPKWATASAGLYWSDQKLNSLADLGTLDGFRVITRRINTAMLKIEARVLRWKNARLVLGAN